MPEMAVPNRTVFLTIAVVRNLFVVQAGSDVAEIRQKLANFRHSTISKISPEPESPQLALEQLPKLMSDCSGNIQKLVAAGLRAGDFSKQLKVLGPAGTPAPTNSRGHF